MSLATLFFHGSMDQCRNSIAELPPGILGRGDVLPTHIHNFNCFYPIYMSRTFSSFILTMALCKGGGFLHMNLF